MGLNSLLPLSLTAQAGYTEMPPPATLFDRQMTGRVLFIPVSGPRGMGEYARSLTLAIAAKHRWPQLEIHFAVSAAAPYAADTPFPTTLLPSSPTFHPAEICELIRRLRPTLVVFDNAGRTAQMRAAVQFGARVVFVSSRPRQRRKAFRVRWMRMLDEHWIAYPAFIAGNLGPLERLKLFCFGRPAVQYLDAILPPPDGTLAAGLLEKLRVKPGEYVLIVPGGGSDHPGAKNVSSVVTEAARHLTRSGVLTVLVGVTHTQPDGTYLPRHMPRIPMAQLAELIRGSRLVVSNGGDTLLQAIACEKPCIAVAIAPDQAHRIRQCERAGLILSAKLESEDIASSVIDLLDDESRRAQLATRLAANIVKNGMESALTSIERLARG